MKNFDELMENLYNITKNVMDKYLTKTGKMPLFKTVLKLVDEECLNLGYDLEHSAEGYKNEYKDFLYAYYILLNRRQVYEKIFDGSNADKDGFSKNLFHYVGLKGDLIDKVSIVLPSLTEKSFNDIKSKSGVKPSFFNTFDDVKNFFRAHGIMWVFLGERGWTLYENIVREKYSHLS